MSTFKVSTKKDKTAAAVNTTLTVIEDASPQVLAALAMQTVVIRWQAWARKHGIPATASIKMSEYAPGVRHAAPTLQESIASMTPDEKAKYIKLLQDSLPK